MSHFLKYCNFTGVLLTHHTLICTTTNSSSTTTTRCSNSGSSYILWFSFLKYQLYIVLKLLPTVANLDATEAFFWRVTKMFAFSVLKIYCILCSLKIPKLNFVCFVLHEQFGFKCHIYQNVTLTSLNKVQFKFTLSWLLALVLLKDLNALCHMRHHNYNKTL